MRLPFAANTVARRGFHSTRPQAASPYHYPEGPRSNIPFNPLTRFFAVRYWGFMGMRSQISGSGVVLMFSSCRVRRTICDCRYSHDTIQAFNPTNTDMNQYGKPRRTNRWMRLVRLCVWKADHTFGPGGNYIYQWDCADVLLCQLEHSFDTQWVYSKPEMSPV